MLSIIIFSLVFIFELIGIVLLEFSPICKYSNLNTKDKFLLRFLMTVPLFYICVFNNVYHPNLYNILVLISIVLVFIADLAIIKSLLIGLGVFAIVHIINAVNFWIYSPNSFNLFSLVIIFSISLGLYFIFLYKKLDTFMKILTFIYLLIISISVWRSSELNNSLLLFTALSGNILFFLCDFEVAYTEFVNKFSGYQIVNHVVYYLGLLLICLSTCFS